MPYDFSSLLVPVFPGINDSPVAPTASKAGNGSHIIGLYNELVNSLETALNSLESAGKHIILDQPTDYSVVGNENLIVFSNDTGFSSINILLPSTPTPGAWVSILSSNAATTVELLNYGKYESQQPLRVFLENDYEAVKLTYINSDFGWMPNKKEVLQTEFGAE